MTLKYHAPFNGLCYGFQAPTNLNRKFVNNGTRVAKFRDTVSSAIELTCNIAFDGAHTPSRRRKTRKGFVMYLEVWGRAMNDA